MIVSYQLPLNTMFGVYQRFDPQDIKYRGILVSTAQHEDVTMKLMCSITVMLYVSR